MCLLIMLGFMVGMSWLFPAGSRYLLVAPLLGFLSGGFAWGFAAMFLPALITVTAFACFIVAGVVIAELVTFLTR